MLDSACHRAQARQERERAVLAGVDAQVKTTAEGAHMLKRLERSCREMDGVAELKRACIAQAHFSLGLWHGVGQA